MLIEFNAENYRSIKEKATFSMLASSDKSLESNLIKSDGLHKNDNLLKSAVIYGANASGKSNVLKAMGALKFIVTNSNKNQIGDLLPYRPFKLCKESLTMPTQFNITFIENAVRYRYEVSFTNEKVINESLYYYPKNREAMIFERTNTTKFDFNVDKKIQNDISNRTLENVLYLSNSAQQNYEKTIEPFKWFKDKFQVIGPTENFKETYTINMINRDDESKKQILKFLEEADLSIVDIDANVKNISIDNLPPEILSKFPQGFSDAIDKIEEVEFKSFHNAKDGDNKSYEAFKFSEESGGTQRMFSLIGPWLDALIKGQIIVIDELDIKLHSLITNFLIELFHDPTQNKNNAQLIFTTHNTYSLNQKTFRRDQIWFTEKSSESGETVLYSLSEFKPRKDKDIQSGYLMGRFGALPFIASGRVF